MKKRGLSTSHTYVHLNVQEQRIANRMDQMNLNSNTVEREFRKRVAEYKGNTNGGESGSVSAPFFKLSPSSFAPFPWKLSFAATFMFSFDCRTLKRDAECLQG